MPDVAGDGPALRIVQRRRSSRIRIDSSVYTTVLASAGGKQFA
jgi:hypothetical protein